MIDLNSVEIRLFKKETLSLNEVKEMVDEIRLLRECQDEAGAMYRAIQVFNSNQSSLMASVLAAANHWEIKAHEWNKGMKLWT